MIPAARPRDASAAELPVAGWLVLATLLHWTFGGAMQRGDRALGLALSEGLLFGVGAFVVPWLYRLPPREVLGLRAPRLRSLPWLALLAFASFALAGGLAALNRHAADALSALLGGGSLTALDPSLKLPFGDPVQGPPLVLAVVLVAPITEELLYRGLLLRWLGAKLSDGVAVGLSAALFSLLHLNPSSALGLFSLGVVFGLARRATGSVLAPIALHVVQNGLSVALLASGISSGAPEELPVAQAVGMTLVAGVATVGLLRGLARVEPVAAAELPEAVFTRSRLIVPLLLLGLYFTAFEWLSARPS